MNWYFISAWFFTILIFGAVQINSDLLVAVFGFLMFISAIAGLLKEKKEKEEKEKWIVK